MKKTLKISALLMVVAIMLLALTGCGKNKIVATKSTDDSMFGSYEEKMEITFKNDKADKVVWTMEFKEEDKAKAASGIYQMASSELKDLEVKQNGKKVVLTMGAESFAKSSDSEKDLTRDEIIKKLEDQGYKVKK